MVTLAALRPLTALAPPAAFVRGWRPLPSLLPSLERGSPLSADGASPPPAAGAELSSLACA